MINNNCLPISLAIPLIVWRSSEREPDKSTNIYKSRGKFSAALMDTLKLWVCPIIRQNINEIEREGETSISPTLRRTVAFFKDIWLSELSSSWEEGNNQDMIIV